MAEEPLEPSQVLLIMAAEIVRVPIAKGWGDLSKVSLELARELGQGSQCDQVHSGQCLKGVV
jgi:hypothetical protein